jgi:hypothetical protein
MLFKKLIFFEGVGPSEFDHLRKKFHKNHKLIWMDKEIDQYGVEKYHFIVRFTNRVDFICFLLTISSEIIEKTESVNEAILFPKR